MEELKPCPYCGGEAEIQKFSGKNGTFLVARCKFCYAQARTILLKEGKEEQALERVTTFWNRRA